MYGSLIKASYTCLLQLLYSLMVPLGIIVGMYLAKALSSDLGIAVRCLAQAYAAGSFMYVCLRCTSFTGKHNTILWSMTHVCLYTPRHVAGMWPACRSWAVTWMVHPRRAVLE